MTQSQVIAFPQQDQIELQQTPTPEIRPHEMRVRLEYSGVSQGTEIWALVGKRPELAFPTVPGYQSVGRIEAVGDEVKDFEPGQRVLFHRARLPESWPDTWMAAHMSPAVVSTRDDPPPRRVPEGVDPVAASLAALLSVAYRGVNMLRIELNDVVVVMGQGLIGQAAAQLARLRGAMVIASDVHARRLELSRQYSADQVVNASKESLADAVRRVKPQGADIVIDTTGRSDLWPQWIDLLRLKGQILMQGWYPQPVTFDFHDTHMKRPTIAVTCGIADTQPVLELMRLERLRWRELVTHLVPVAEAPSLYRQMAANDPDVLGVVFDWSGV